MPNSNSHKNWIAVASAEHARLGRSHVPMGFMQVGHGKETPLKRVKPGDRVAYYAPTTVFGKRDELQSFVSIGVVQPGEPYPFDMGADGMANGFVAWRRDVQYAASHEAPILPLLDAFEFIEDRSRWGYKFRFGIFTVSDHDMWLIARAMGASTSALGF